MNDSSFDAPDSASAPKDDRPQKASAAGRQDAEPQAVSPKAGSHEEAGQDIADKNEAVPEARTDDADSSKVAGSPGEDGPEGEGGQDGGREVGDGQESSGKAGLSEEDIAQLRAIQKRRLIVFGILGVVLLILGFFAGRAMRNQQAEAAGPAHCLVVQWLPGQVDGPAAGLATAPTPGLATAPAADSATAPTPGLIPDLPGGQESA